MHAQPVRRYLRSLQAAGLRRIPRAARAATSPGSAAGGAGAEVSGDSLEAVAHEVAACTACRLAETRRNTVPGEGAPDAAVVFVGEGPGADEDASGRPFVGPAGQLLDRIIEGGMKLRRDDVFIANVVKCRPPGNRAPLPDEVAACSGFLRRQLALLRPRVICALGRSAANALLDNDLPIGRMRGRPGAFEGIPVIPTYHPAYLLRTPSAKVATWEDIQKVMELAGIR